MQLIYNLNKAEANSGENLLVMIFCYQMLICKFFLPCYYSLIQLFIYYIISETFIINCEDVFISIITTNIVAILKVCVILIAIFFVQFFVIIIFSIFVILIVFLLMILIVSYFDRIVFQLIKKNSFPLFLFLLYYYNVH